MLRPLLILFVYASGLPAQSQSSRAAESRAALGFVQKYCAACHAGQEPEAQLDLDQLIRRPLGAAQIKTWLEVRDTLKVGDMPPEDEPQPSAAERTRFLRWLGAQLREAGAKTDPGRVTMRRLSRYEYRQTVRDLCGVAEDVTQTFPADDLSYGFDNNGDSLRVSTLHLEKYARAAGRVAELAIRCDDPRVPARRSFDLRDHLPANNHRVRERGEQVVFTSNATVSIRLRSTRASRYLLHVEASAQQAGKDLAKMAVLVDGKTVAQHAVKAHRPATDKLSIPLELPAGQVRLGIAFVNDYYNAKHKDRKRRDRNLWIEGLVLEGPLDPLRETPFQQRLLARDPGGKDFQLRARKVLGPFLEVAWRRPVRSTELRRLARLVAARGAAGDPFPLAVRLAVQAALVSPNFLFRIETQSSAADAATVEDLDDHALATRLSYFLWSSMPDAQLRRRADLGELKSPAALRQQVVRMLADRRARSLAQNFASQWLELRRLDEVSPDPRRFGPFEPALRKAMRQETVAFFGHVLTEGLPIQRLLDARFTFLNETLARHYGIPGVVGGRLRKVALEDPRRGGLITQAAILAVTSNPTRTSPVKRGKWLLEQILDDPPPAPPPGFDSFQNAGADLSKAATLREQMALHRSNQACAVCHTRMDALGLSMENYDAIGRWREQDHGQPIDVRGELPGGRVIHGVADLRRVLIEGDAFRICLAKKLFLFALGRELRGIDALVLDARVRALPKSASIADLIHLIVQLDAFRRRLRT